MIWDRATLITAALILLAFAVGAAFCIIAIVVDPPSFFRVWLAPICSGSGCRCAASRSFSCTI